MDIVITKGTFRDDWSSRAPGSSVSLRWPEAAA